MPGIYELAPDLWMPQARGIGQVMDRLSAGKDVCLYGPTGSGKTRCAIELFKWAEYLGMGGCFYVNRKLLVGQTAARFAAAGLDYGIRAADYEDEFRPHSPFQICSADTERSRVIDRKVWQLHKSGLVIVDEAHIQRTETMKWLLMNHRDNGAMIVLLTATPIGLSDWCDELVVSGRLQEYRDCHALVPAIVKSIEQPDVSKVKRNATGEYVIDGEKRKIYTQQIVGSVLARWKEFNPDARSTMLYAPGVAESVWFTEQFRKIGVNWCHVDATDAVVDGKRYTLNRTLWTDILARYEAGEIKGLSSRMKLREGIDVPSTYHAILATPIGSLASYIQTCLDSKTEILTSDGWRGIENISYRHLVASFDEKSEDIVWNPVEKIIKRRIKPSEGMFGVQSPHLDIRVTGTHEFIFRSPRAREWKRSIASSLAKDRAASYQIPVAADSWRPGIALSDHEIRFLGWWITDGTASYENHTVSICQSLASDPSLHDDIKKTLNGCGFTYKTYVRKRTGAMAGYADSIIYTISPHKGTVRGWWRLREYLDKDLSPLLMEMSRDQLLVFLDAVNNGDGSKMKTASWTPRTLEISTGNKTFADRLQAICVTAGMRCNVSTVNNHGGVLHYIRPSVNKTRATIGGNGDKGRSVLAAVDYLPTERVWCVKTATGTIVTRRNGKVAILGNCGRVLRYSSATPDHVLVTDHGGNYWRHGSPNQDRDWQSWWTMPEHAVSEIHTNEIRDGKREEPIVCPQCRTERSGGRKCPICDFEHAKSKRSVIMEDGRMVERDGNLVPPRRIRNKPDTADLWAGMFWGFRKKKVERSFEQMYAYFANQYHYHPPRDLPYMPKNQAHWYSQVHAVPFQALHEKPQN